jgi:hypothetical protein
MTKKVNTKKERKALKAAELPVDYDLEGEAARLFDYLWEAADEVWRNADSLCSATIKKEEEAIKQAWVIIKEAKANIGREKEMASYTSAAFEEALKLRKVAFASGYYRDEVLRSITVANQDAAEIPDEIPF